MLAFTYTTVVGLWLAAGGVFNHQVQWKPTPGGAPELSPQAQALLRGQPGDWKHLATRHFIVHAQSVEVLKAAAREVESAYQDLSRRLDVPEDEQVTHLFMVESAADWDALVQQAHLRVDGLALHRNREVFIHVVSEHPQVRLQIPHEVVHLLIDTHYPGALPLWYEEGLAQYLAWSFAQAFHATARSQLERHVVPVPPSELWPLEALTAATEYPEDEARARSFYRQSEELVRAIAQTVGRHELGAYTKALANAPDDWKKILKDNYRCQARDLTAIEEVSAARSRGEGPGS